MQEPEHEVVIDVTGIPPSLDVIERVRKALDEAWVKVLDKTKFVPTGYQYPTWVFDERDNFKLHFRRGQFALSYQNESHTPALAAAIEYAFPGTHLINYGQSSVMASVLTDAPEEVASKAADALSAVDPLMAGTPPTLDHLARRNNHLDGKITWAFPGDYSIEAFQTGHIQLVVASTQQNQTMHKAMCSAFHRQSLERVMDLLCPFLRIVGLDQFQKKRAAAHILDTLRDKHALNLATYTIGGMLWFGPDIPVCIDLTGGPMYVHTVTAASPKFTSPLVNIFRNALTDFMAKMPHAKLSHVSSGSFPKKTENDLAAMARCAHLTAALTLGLPYDPHLLPGTYLRKYPSGLIVDEVVTCGDSSAFLNLSCDGQHRFVAFADTPEDLAKVNAAVAAAASGEPWKSVYQPVQTMPINGKTVIEAMVAVAAERHIKTNKSFVKDDAVVFGERWDWAIWPQNDSEYALARLITLTQTPVDDRAPFDSCLPESEALPKDTPVVNTSTKQPDPAPHNPPKHSWKIVYNKKSIEIPADQKWDEETVASFCELLEKSKLINGLRAMSRPLAVPPVKFTLTAPFQTLSLRTLASLPARLSPLLSKFWTPGDGLVLREPAPTYNSFDTPNGRIHATAWPMDDNGMTWILSPEGDTNRIPRMVADADADAVLAREAVNGLMAWAALINESFVAAPRSTKAHAVAFLLLPHGQETAETNVLYRLHAALSTSKNPNTPPSLNRCDGEASSSYWNIGLPRRWNLSFVGRNVVAVHAFTGVGAETWETAWRAFANTLGATLVVATVARSTEKA